jgi:N-acyl-D-amino-acid deacylase
MQHNQYAKAHVGLENSAWSRRDFLRTGALAAVALTRTAAWAQSGEAIRADTPFAAFDREIQKFMEARNVPGGALAVVKDRRLAYTRGYGWADRENKVPVKPTSLFRIASISKPFTAVAVLKLTEEKKLRLDAPVWGLLELASRVPARKNADERWKQTTVRHLLQHTGGWDRDKSFDPMFRPREIARSFGLPSPPDPRVIIRYMLGKTLDFDPGTRYAYSNFGYCVLGRVIERISGTSYEKFVREKVQAPIGIRRMRIGASLANQRVESEVRYYTPHEETGESVFDDLHSTRSPSDGQTDGDKSNPLPAPPKEGSNRGGASAQVPSRVGQGVGSVRENRRAGKQVSWPYGRFCLESMDAHGGWIASAVDLARFAAALHDAKHNRFLKPETIRIMHMPPEPLVSRNADGSLKDYYYGCGWLARPVGNEGRANYWHNGSLPGTSTLLVRRHDGISWAILFNQRSEDKNLPDSEIDPALHRAANAVSDWPKHDLFRQYLRS